MAVLGHADRHRHDRTFWPHDGCSGPRLGSTWLNPHVSGPRFSSGSGRARAGPGLPKEDCGAEEIWIAFGTCLTAAQAHCCAVARTSDCLQTNSKGKSNACSRRTHALVGGRVRPHSGGFGRGNRGVACPLHRDGCKAKEGHSDPVAKRERHEGLRLSVMYARPRNPAGGGPDPKGRPSLARRRPRHRPSLSDFTG